MDAPIAALLAERCGIGAADTELWQSLPYALALMLGLPEWAPVGVRLQEDTIGGNVHCIVHAIDALLTLAAPHMANSRPQVPAEAAAAHAGRLAHRRFVEVASLVLLQQRQALAAGAAPPKELATRERTLAAVTLVVEQLVQHASLLSYGALEAYVPYALLLSAYTTVAQPVVLTPPADGAHGLLGGATQAPSDAPLMPTMPPMSRAPIDVSDEQHRASVGRAAAPHRASSGAGGFERIQRAVSGQL